MTRRHPDWEMTAIDNLYRRGSELNLARLEAAGVRFVAAMCATFNLARVRGDRCARRCSAEPSALMGDEGDGEYGFHTNLTGAFNCLELVRRSGARLVFLSTSRIYPYPALNALDHREGESRFELLEDQDVEGASESGISERFPLDGPRTFYGTTKLSAELLIGEYVAAHGISAVIDRCGVIAGPWQMGKVDQGVFTYWVLHHHFGLPLRYIGYGGRGKQVRDLIARGRSARPDRRTTRPTKSMGRSHVQCGRRPGLQPVAAGGDADLPRPDRVRGPDRGRSRGEARRCPVYLSDCRALFERTAWRPRRNAGEILAEVHAWVGEAEPDLERVLRPASEGT